MSEIYSLSPPLCHNVNR